MCVLDLFISWDLWVIYSHQHVDTAQNNVKSSQNNDYGTRMNIEDIHSTRRAINNKMSGKPSYSS